MIIFGTTTLNSTRETGAFHCPRCSADREYRLRQANRFFTIYFIPLIPMGSAGRFVECTSCGGTYAEEVLQYDPQADRQQVGEEFRRMLILLILGRGLTESKHIQAMREVMQSTFDMTVTDEQIKTDVSLANEVSAELVPYVQSVAEGYSADGKALVIQAAARVMAPDRPLDEADKQMIRELGNALGFQPAAVESFFESIDQ